MTLALFKTLPKAVLSEYDMIICIDKSGSMSYPSEKPQFKARWNEAEEMTRGFAEFADAVDDDGITVITFGGSFNHTRDVQDGVTAASVHDIFTNQGPGGSTPLHSAIKAAISKFESGSKKAFVIIVTDGVPDDGPMAAKLIVEAGNRLTNGDELTFLFIQVGNDPSAKKYLVDLDDNLGRLGAKHDIVDCISHDEAEGMTYEEMLSKALVD